MIESFNGWVFFILYVLNLAGGGYYAYQSVLNTENFMEKYGIHKSAMLPMRLAGSFDNRNFRKQRKHGNP